MQALNPWFAGYLDGIVETAPKGPVYTVDFLMNASSVDKAELQHIYTAEDVPDPAGGAGYFYIPGSGDNEYALNKGTIMAAERDGMWHRASERWEAAVGPALPATYFSRASSPAPVVLKVVALPATHVGEKMAYRGLGSRRFIGHLEIRQIAPHRRVQLYLAYLGQAHDRRAGEGLGDGTDLEEGIGGDRQGMVNIGDAEAGRSALAFVQNAYGDAGDAAVLHQPGDKLA